MRLRANLLAGLFAGCLLAIPSSASEIGSANKVHPTWDVHETISILAFKCAQSPVKPENCRPEARSILDPVRQNEKKSREGDKDERFFAVASRWSDDPLRMLHGGTSPLLFGLTMLDKCERANARGPRIDQRGMMCASHYGPMQFAHAQDDMSPSSDRPRGPRLSESRDKMLAWARFAFRAAVDRSFAGLSFCQAIADPAFAPIAASLAQPSRCDDRRPYTVASFFSGHCRALSFRNCADLSQRHGETYVRNAGAGAILHLIQDSYSQSHAARLPDRVAAEPANAVFPSLSACHRIAAFYDYNAQKDEESETHGNADQPALIDTSCMNSERESDDVITGSARAIWVIQQAWHGRGGLRALEDQMVGDLKARVLTLREPS